ncbi:MAG TPA: hypothetical protein VHC72_10795, partial [Bryobacteraceae bacterium]|nr:hypothetical protein [Bryobacteraceae bacterium]
AVLVTTTYRAGRAIALPTLQCEHTHFATHQNTDAKTLGDYLHWFGALNLVSEEDAAATLAAFTPGGPSSCVLHTAFGDRESAALFLDGNMPKPRSWYLELGRRALRAMLDVEHQPNDRLRYRILDDALWSRALDIGANVNLGPLVGLSTADERVGYLVGDLFIITGWADAMATAAELVRDIRNFVGSAEPAALLENDAFRKKRDTLQRKLSAVVQASKTRFDTPWGMVSLFLAAGSPPTAWGKAVARGLAIERHSSPAIAAAQP